MLREYAVQTDAYVRIDEYSKGYLTGWLRVAGIVGVAAAGLIFLMR